MKIIINLSLFFLVIINNLSTLPTVSSVPVKSPNLSTLPMALSAPLKPVPGKRTIFAHNLVHTAFKPIGQTPLQTENITVTAFFPFQYDNLLAYCDVVLEELKQRNSTSDTIESLKAFYTESKQTLKEDQQDLVFFLLDNEDYSQHTNDEIAKIKFIEESHSYGRKPEKPERGREGEGEGEGEGEESHSHVRKPENIVTVEIKATQNDNDQEDFKAYIRVMSEICQQNGIQELFKSEWDVARSDAISQEDFKAFVSDQLQINLTLGIQKFLKFKLDVARSGTNFLKTMVDPLKNSSTAKELFLFIQSPKELLEEINNKAALLGLENMIVESADYDKLQVTTTLNSKGINFTFEVPCMKPNTTMTLYSYKPLPMVINKNLTNDVQAALYIESQEANIIAVGQDNTTYTLLKQDDLHCSLEFNGVKVCKGLIELRNNLTDSCLGALFMQDNKHIALHCQFEVRKLSLDSVYLGNNRYNIICPNRFYLQFDCPSRNDSYVMSIPSPNLT
jgi:hypothetical protein